MALPVKSLSSVPRSHDERREPTPESFPVPMPYTVSIIIIIAIIMITNNESKI